MISRKAVISDNKNPLAVQFQGSVPDVYQMSLIYFRLTGLDMTRVPDALFISVDGIPGLEQSQSLISGIRIPSSCVPVYFKLEKKYNDGVDPDTQYRVIHGIQPPTATWSIQGGTSINLTTAEIKLFDQTGSLYTLDPTSRIYLTFELHYKIPGYVADDWRTNRVILSALDA